MKLIALCKIKRLKRENLRDHMDDFELIFTMLGERATTEIHRTEDSRGVPKLKADAKAGGDIAGNARKQLEKRIKRPIVSRDNFLEQTKKAKKLSKDVMLSCRKVRRIREINRDIAC